MTDPSPTGGSRAVQGCLLGAVALFALLLIVMIILAYQRFREETSEAVTSPPTGMSYPAVESTISPSRIDHTVPTTVRFV